jgi:hypothetical protein
VLDKHVLQRALRGSNSIHDTRVRIEMIRRNTPKRSVFFQRLRIATGRAIVKSAECFSPRLRLRYGFARLLFCISRTLTRHIRTHVRMTVGQ